MKTKKTTKELIEVKNNIFSKIKNWLKKLRLHKYEENNKTDNLLNISENIETLDNAENFEVTNQSINKIIVNAQKAYENYVLNDEYGLSENLYNLIKERINANRDNI